MAAEDKLHRRQADKDPSDLQEKSPQTTYTSTHNNTQQHHHQTLNKQRQTHERRPGWKVFFKKNEGKTSSSKKHWLRAFQKMSSANVHYCHSLKMLHF